MFQAYVVVGNKKNTDYISANPYIMEISDDKLFLKEIEKEDITGLVYFLIEELSPKEICVFKDFITAIGVDGIIKIRQDSLKK